MTDSILTSSCTGCRLTDSAKYCWTSLRQHLFPNYKSTILCQEMMRAMSFPTCGHAVVGNIYVPRTRPLELRTFRPQGHGLSCLKYDLHINWLSRRLSDFFLFVCLVVVFLIIQHVPNSPTTVYYCGSLLDVRWTFHKTSLKFPHVRAVLLTLLYIFIIFTYVLCMFSRQSCSGCFHFWLFWSNGVDVKPCSHVCLFVWGFCFLGFCWIHAPPSLKELTHWGDMRRLPFLCAVPPHRAFYDDVIFLL